ncbi:AAA family ATPase [Aeoliella sp. SH292]|uniref:AAA family ATPase n=1 Tax=Aeoliella sp. SH292 TaxID=3454464 RepID=UPI003F9559AB
MRTLTQNDVCNMVRKAQRDGVKFTPSESGELLIETPASLEKWHGAFNGYKPAVLQALDVIRNGGLPSDFNPPVVQKFSVGELQQAYPRQRPPVVDGLFRESETINLIANSKVGKTWGLYGLLLCIVMGWRWLDRFDTTPGKVLLIDNELHRETIPQRIATVAQAMDIPPECYTDYFDVIPLRGCLRSLTELQHELQNYPVGEYKVIGFDAKYRFAADGQSENDNAAETRFYNQVDEIAEQTGSAIILIHHASKGDQSGKRTTDVGSGAGAQSRAADCHLVLREHESQNRVVLDAAVRSFPPVASMVLEWRFPLWLPDDTADPGKLKGIQGHQKEQEERRDAEGIKLIANALSGGIRATRSQLRTKTGMGPDRTNKLVAKMLEDGSLKTKEVDVKGNVTDEFWLSTTAE